MYERRYLTIAASCAVLSLCGAAPSPASAATQVWNTPGPQQWVVPDGITSATFQLYGASGGGIGGSIGGKGGRTVATIAVTPGETLNLYVGGAGPPPNMGSGGGGGATGGSPVCSNPSWPCVGGTGGGASDVRQGGIAAANRVLVAGGGGGAGGASSGECNMVGCLTSVAGGDGGDGGTAVAGRGADGQNGVVVNPGETPTGGCGGGGGTQTAGGAAGGTTAGELCNGPTGNTAGGNTEVGGRGGDSALGAGSGGGGGGGFFGGGGGSGGGHESNNGGGGGGGGGSNYIAAGATDVTSTAGASSGDGEVIVTYGVSHTLTVTASGAGGVTSSPAGIDCGGTCTHAFDDGTAVTLTPAAAAGSTFGGWSGACSGTGSCVVTMSADQAVGATFTPNPPPPGTHSLTVTTSGPGSVVSSPAGVDCGTTCVHSYDAGTSVTLTAVAAAGSAFTGWSGACAGTGPCTVAMSTDQAVSASFTPITRRVGPPNTLITKVVVRSKTHRATFKFKGVGGIGKLHFRCSLDSRKFLPCRSPKPYRHLKPGGHTLLVKAIDSRGRADPTPATRAFSI